MPVGSRDQGGPDAAAQEHQGAVGKRLAAPGQRRDDRIERRDLDRAVRRHDVVAGGAGWNRQARAHAVAQQLQPGRGQIRREPGDADVDAVDVVQGFLLGPAILRGAGHAEAEYRAEECRAAGQVADRDGGVIDAQEAARAARVPPLPWLSPRGEREQLQRVAVVIPELEREHAARALGQLYRAGPADRPEPRVRHDLLMGGRHVADDDRHVLEPEIGARAVRWVRASRRVGELQQFDLLVAQPQ